MDLNTLRLFQLKKQNLIKKARSKEYSTLFKEHIGLHSTDYLTPYLSLWARIENFEPKTLFEDLNHRRNALRIRAFRGTLFVVHKDNLKLILSGFKNGFTLRIYQAKKLALKKGLYSESLERKITGILSGNKQLTGSEIKKMVSVKVNSEQFMHALRYLEFKGVIARTKQRYITDHTIRYGLMKDWMPDITLDKIDPQEALEKLILSYIKKFGPVCLEDVCWWLPVSKTLAKKSTEALKNKLTFFPFNDREYIMESEDYNEFMNFKPTKRQNPVITFLPYEDHFPKAYTIRNWYITEEAIALVFNMERKIEYGQIRPSIWLNGEIIGRWELEWMDKEKSSAKVEIIEINKKLTLSKNITTLIMKEKKKLEEFINEKMIPLIQNNNYLSWQK